MSLQRDQLPALTAPRFLAAVAVFYTHCWGVFKGPTGDTGFTVPHFHVAAAVQFFYLLSGFILTYNYGHEFCAPTRRGVWNFYVARLARLYPIHLLAMLIAVPFTVAVYVRPGVVSDSWAYALAHVALLNGFVPEASPGVQMFNPSAWSLSTEVFFYLLFPLLVPLLAAGSAARRAFWTVVLLAPWAGTLGALLCGYELPWWLSPYRFPPVRTADFVFGVLLGAAWRDRAVPRAPARFATARELFAVGSLVACGWALAKVLGGSKYEWTVSWSGVYLVPFALCVWVFARGEGRVSRALAMKVPTYLGEIGYALYMLHLPVFLLLARYGVKYGVHAWSWPAQWALATACGFALAVLSYHLVELPLRDRLRKALSIRKPKPPEVPAAPIEVGAPRRAA
jgi:peptidoglycan/LPS O-acetylase OafA/YrhL